MLEARKGCLGPLLEIVEQRLLERTGIVRAKRTHRVYEISAIAREGDEEGERYFSGNVQCA
jgi:hypothetical protein